MPKYHADGQTFRRSMVRLFLMVSLAVFFSLVSTGSSGAAELALSEATKNCLVCHESATPGIVADWKKSRHSRTTPTEALKKPQVARLVSAEKIPKSLAGVTVGCAECHLLNPSDHKDSFDHDVGSVHIVVTPRDCATCHPVEAKEYDRNKMAWANPILKNNSLYQNMIGAVAGTWTLDNRKLEHQPPDAVIEADACYHCHGTTVDVTGKITRQTDQGTFDFPVLSGWPNQGVGRINPDGSRGSCASCHTRHQFSIKEARQPYTCAQCHKGPDVPAYKIYEVSKHGNVFSAMKSTWNLEAVPWAAGADFATPTCAACHVSLVVDSTGEIVAKRTHRMNDRLPWRLFGLIYAHPQPKDPDTSKIKNKAGLPLPTELTGEPVAEALIDTATQAERTKIMQKICLACHSTGWVEGHWTRIEKSITTSNTMTRTATQLMIQAWNEGVAQGPPAAANPFDEALERKWMETWLFYANSIRMASAMGGADYGVFAEGRWHLTRTLQELKEWIELKATKK